ncbi:3' exoribonuclease family, domain 1-domain-containing protein [Pyronema omphalodes]|nr:3' exoribonuclease family, domain 1-domain-containing protein [Pyronema omphalodes]
MALADRRRINGPLTGTTPPLFTSTPESPVSLKSARDIRPVFIKTSLTPPAHGSAYLEIHTSTLKLSASVYGPRPLPPSAPFSPHARVTAEVKFAPFSTPGTRRGYVRDNFERDLSSQLQIALCRVINTAKYPKSGVDVFVTIIDTGSNAKEVNEFEILTAAINVSSVAVCDAGVEMVDLVSAGFVGRDAQGDIVCDPENVMEKMCLVSYMAARDEITMVWTKGEMDGEEVVKMTDVAAETAGRTRGVVSEAVKERVWSLQLGGKPDVKMSG